MVIKALNLFEWNGVYGFKPYVPRLASLRQKSGSDEERVATEWIYAFKSKGKNSDAIMESLSLEDDLAVDSLDMVEIVMEIEDDYPELGGISDEDAQQWASVKDIVDYVQGKLEK